MKINQVEQAVGVTKKNIRFYEQEGLLSPNRIANGYREYSPEDVETLRRIKLLRKLDIPIEEIKRIQNKSLTLEDCLHRHLIVLKRRRSNLDAMESFCRRLMDEGANLSELDVEQLLLEMEQQEKGGVHFMDIHKGDKRKQKRIVVAAVIIPILLMAAPIAAVIWLKWAEPKMPTVLLLFLIALPLMGIIGTLIALRERFKEIEGGELDEASKY